MASAKAVSDQELVASGNKFYKILAKKYRWLAEDDDDIQQEILYALLRARERFDPSKSGWNRFAEITARSAVQDYFRRPRNGTVWHRRSGTARFSLSFDDLLVQPSTNPNLTEHVEIAEMVEKLTPRDRFIVLALLDGFSPAEIARFLGVSDANISQRIFTLRHKGMREWRKDSVAG